MEAAKPPERRNLEKGPHFAEDTEPESLKAWEEIDIGRVHAAPHSGQLSRPRTRLSFCDSVRFGRPDSTVKGERGWS